MSGPLSTFDKTCAAIRADCRAPVWSQGVLLERDGAVTGVSADDEEIVCRVRVPVFPVDPTVVLYPQDGEWECDCRSKEETCSHVAATALAVQRAREQGLSMPSGARGGPQLIYRFEAKGASLVLKRLLRGGEGDERLVKQPLMSLVATRPPGFDFRPTEADLMADRVIGTPSLRPLAPEKISAIFRVLHSDAHVELDGERVRPVGEPLLPDVVVESQGDGVHLCIQRPEGLGEVMMGGLARVGDTLRILGERKLCGLRYEKLPIVRDYPRERLGEFVLEVLPDFEQRFEVQVRTRRLPQVSRFERPRLQMDVKHEGDRLSVMPLLVYGHPAHSRVDQGRLIYLDGPLPQRDIEAERELQARLRDELNLVCGRWVHFEGREAAHFARRLHDWGEDLVDEEQRAFGGERPLLPRLQGESDGFDLWFELPGDEDAEGDDASSRRADAASVLGAWRDGLDLAPLMGGGWAPIPVDWLERHGHLVADLLAARGTDGALSTVALPALGELCAALEMPPPPALQGLRPLLEDFERIPEVELPPGLTAELRGYQRQGVNWLSFLQSAGLGAVLADDMGLGKTLQALCVVRGRTLVVCPTSVLHNWSQEIARFRPDLRCAVYHGPKRALDPEVDVTLTSYALLRIDGHLLRQVHWDCAILDESQNIKNPDSQVARAAFALDADFHLSLSGTPVENRLDELWSQMHFCNRGLLGGRGDFKQRLAQAIEQGDAEAAARLRARIKPFVLRRLKSAVAPELPPRSEAVLRCQLSDSERRVYETVRAASQKKVLEQLAAGGNVMAVLEALLRLRQACCHSGLVPGQEAETSSKIEMLREALEASVANGHKALVFSQWTGLLDRVEPHLRAAGLSFVRLDGSTRKRGEVVAAFQADDGPPLMLISLKAGGTGLNLTAADHVYLLDPWWNPAVEDQAADRSHRIGQDKPVMIYRLVAEDSVEERILELQAKKRAIAEAALGQADQAQKLTREDLVALLQ